MLREAGGRLCHYFATWTPKEEAAEDCEEAKPLLPDIERVAALLSAASTAEKDGHTLPDAEVSLRWVGERCQAQADAQPKVPDLDVGRLCSQGLDVFKGILVIFMTFAHVDLCLMSPMLQYYAPVPHFVGNMASGLCFLGFMFAYGFGCNGAYLSDAKARPPGQQLRRLGRSVALPILGAWVCSFAWGLMCFKLPVDAPTVLGILSFRLAVGNGPDFLLCFPVCLLIMFPLRHVLSRELACPSAWRRLACAAAMLLAPLALTRCTVQDCTGLRKYLNYFLECSVREAWSPNLPALPHLFYFNLGVLVSRGVVSAAAALKAGYMPDPRRLCAGYVAFSAGLLFMSYPLLTVWDSSYGNISIATKWGTISRGFSGGPSVLWLLGNLFGLEVVLATSIALCFFTAEQSEVPPLGQLLRLLRGELQHLGANVLLYLVVADICLAGLYRGAQGQFPLDARGGAAATLGLLMVARFLHYLGASGRASQECG